MDPGTPRLLERLSAVEEAAEDVLTCRQQIVDLDSKRNRNREALSALRDVPDSEKVKLCFGNMFIKFSKSQSQQLVERDQQHLEQEIDTLHKALRAKVNHLNYLQGKPELRGTSLSPLSSEEIRAVNVLLEG